jgi:hypothetical protein
MQATVSVSWPDLGAPESILDVCYAREQEKTLRFLLAEGNGLSIALSKVKAWQNKPRPAGEVLIHQSDIHQTYVCFDVHTVTIRFMLRSSLSDIENATWGSPKACPLVGEWISGPTTGGQPVRVMGHYVGKNGSRNVIFGFSGSKPVSQTSTGLSFPRLTIGTMYARDFS